MSRCFPYRPVRSGGTVGGGGGRQPLIGTIKLQCEKENSKTISLKEKNRERKEKRIDKKGKEEKPDDFGVGKVKKLKYEEFCEEEKSRYLLGGCILKRNEGEEAERLEKSSLTDEHDEPVCYLSDGTQSSNKRKRQLSNPNSPSITVHKNIIRIRLPSQKHRETVASLSMGQPCSTSKGAANSLSRKEAVRVPSEDECCLSNDVGKEASPMLDFGRKESIGEFGGRTASGTTSGENKMQSPKSVYKSLIEDWIPPPFPSGPIEGDDQDWFFCRKHQPRESKRSKAANDVSGCRVTSLWPCAHHLPEADIHALPYAIPY